MPRRHARHATKNATKSAEECRHEECLWGAGTPDRASFGEDGSFAPRDSRGRLTPHKSGSIDSFLLVARVRGQECPRHTTYRASSGTTFNSSFSVHRSTVSEQLTPPRTSVSPRYRPSPPATGWPSSATITSPSRNPARFAGLFSSTEITTTPVSFGRS